MRYLVQELRGLVEMTVLDYSAQYHSFLQNIQTAKKAKNTKDMQYWIRMLRVLMRRARVELSPGDRKRAEQMNPQQLFVRMAKPAVKPRKVQPESP